MLNWFARCPQWVRPLSSITMVAIGMLSLAACGGGSSGGSQPPSASGGSTPPPATPPATPPPAIPGQVDTTPPSAPTGVSAVAASPSDINISWTAAPSTEEVTSYKVYRGGTLIATVQSTSHADTGLTAATQHCYDVTASDAAANESPRSEQACATTAAPADTTAPTVTSTTPANRAVNVGVDSTIRIVFSEPMNAATLTQTTFTLTDDQNNPVSGTVSYSGTTATFKPTSLLAASETYTAALTVDAQDAAGNRLAAAYSWSFKTGLALYGLTAVGEDVEGDDESVFTLVADLNEQGDVAGEAMRTRNLNGGNRIDESVAFLWRNGRLIYLTDGTNSPESRAQGINDRAEVVGYSYQGPDIEPSFLWRDNKVSTLPLRDAYAINNAGQVVGYVDRVENDEGFSVPVIWKNGQITELDGLANPWNISEAGDIVGFAYVEFRLQAALWKAGVVKLLGKLPDAESSQAFDINAQGQVTGTNNFAPPISPDSYNRAFVWQAEKMVELPRVEANHTSTSAYGINDHGHVVGRSGVTQFVATIWIDGEAYDLNDLIATDDPLKQYITVHEAREINNRGQIIVQGTDSRRSGSYSGYLLTPKRAR